MRLPCWLHGGHIWPSEPFNGQREPVICPRCHHVIAPVHENCGKVHDTRGLLMYVCSVTRTVDWRDI